jgi:hypothetical protein
LHRLVQEHVVSAQRLEVIDRFAVEQERSRSFASLVDERQREEVGKAVGRNRNEGELGRALDSTDLHDAIQKARIEIGESVLASTIDCQVRLMRHREHSTERGLGPLSTGGRRQAGATGDGDQRGKQRKSAPTAAQLRPRPQQDPRVHRRIEP